MTRGMLVRHLHEYVESLDEQRYRVALRDNVQAAANKNFYESEEDLSDTATTYWNWYYEARLAQAGVKLPQGARVLDCACGVGRLGGAIARGGAAGVVAFCDLSATQLRTLRSRWKPTPASAGAQLGDLLNMPYADDSFDLVIGNSFLHHLPDVPAALREMYRVCKPGGRVVVLHEPNVYAPFWESLPVSLYRNVYERTDTNNFTDLWCFSGQGMKAIVQEAGFREVRVSARGLLAALFTNPLLVVLRKLRVRSNAVLLPVYRFRVLLDRLEMALTFGRGLPTAPSLLIIARK
ncbi:MAG TPA: methyltransferase domain-containing protein [Thermoanaerobaculia bacterium]